MLTVAVAAFAACLVALLWWQAEPAQSATTAPNGFTDSLVAQVNNPTAMAVAPDGRIFVAQKGGKLRVIKNGKLLSKPFLTVNTDTQFFRGLLGVSFDPNFSTNHYVYIFYTATSPSLHNRVSRFTANGDVAVAGSEKVLLDLPAFPDPNQGAHYGGSLRFGADGKLYVGVGDGDNNLSDAKLHRYSQSIDNLNGKILRINSDGTIPTDNPFYGPTSGDDRIWALGLRQPISLDVQSGTGRMFVNEVGEDSWEEIDEVAQDPKLGAINYGWPDYEGFAPSSPSLQNYKAPLLAYPHPGIDPSAPATGCSITSGAFYDPTTATTSFASYQGKYFYTDYCSGWIRVLDPSSGADSAFASGIVKPVDLEVGENGSLYYLYRGSSSVPAAVRQIR
ncbi:MAG: PQQ-dependent sugar dehydrogenase [Actinomycetota bacterium]|nr:PQQ-dependent sugar dehydrogenase [Actinomycetota bacterium]